MSVCLVLAVLGIGTLLGRGQAYTFSTLTDRAGAPIWVQSPTDLVVDAGGDLFVIEFIPGASVIKRISSSGDVTEFSKIADAFGTAAAFNAPHGLAIDRENHLYVADVHLIWKIAPGGRASALAGAIATEGDLDGLGRLARFNSPLDVAVDPTGALFVADTYNHTVRRVLPDGTVEIWAGTPRIPGDQNGTRLAARFRQPEGIAVDRAGNIFVSSDGAIRRIASDGTVTLLAGAAGACAAVDGAATSARFCSPAGLAVDAAGGIFVADRDNHTIRKIMADGRVLTIGGKAQAPGDTDGAGDLARFRFPRGVALDLAGNVYVADTGNGRIRKAVPRIVPPAIVVQPQSQRVAPGATVVLSVVATGSEPLRYQWQFNGSDISGATEPQLSITNVQLAHQGVYAVAIGNAAGTIVSQIAGLEIATALAPPTISEIADQITEAGHAATVRFVVTDLETSAADLRLSASSTNPALIPDANILLGGTGAERWALILPVPNQTGSADLTITVTDTDGLTTSESFQVTVHPANRPPVFAAIGEQMIDEQTELRLQLTAFDDRTAAADLRFAFVTEPPFGVRLDTNTGLLVWTPTEQQGPSTNRFSIRVADDATPALSATNDLVVVVREVNQPPSVEPVQNRIVTEADAIQFGVLADDSDHPANALRFSLEEAPVGAAIDAATGAFSWVAAARSPGELPATNQVTVRVSDDGQPPLSARTSFQIIVQPKPRPPNQPPVVALTQPAPRSIFVPGSDIEIGASASDPDGQIVRVVFYAGNAPLATNSTPPYVLTWRNVPAGDYVLSAEASDDLGATSKSAAVTIVVRRFRGDVAIVGRGADREIAAIQDYLFDLGLSSVAFEPEQVSSALLESFRAAIWLGSNSTNAAPTAHAVGAFQAMSAAGKPLYFLGERLAAAAGALRAPERSTWTALLGLQLPNGLPVFGPIALDPFAPHPIANGPFGSAENFAYAAPIEAATISLAGGAVLARAGEASVLLAFPADPNADGIRTVTQNFSLTEHGGAESIEQRRRIFQNAICWLIRCRPCTSFHLDLDLRGPVEPKSIGDPIIYTHVLRHTGECEVTGVTVKNVLPSQTWFVGARAVQGTWHYDPKAHVVTFAVGRMISALEVELEVTMVSDRAGIFTNTASASASGGRGAVAANATATVQDNTRPTLSIVKGKDAVCLLRAVGPSARKFQIQMSNDLIAWRDLGDAVAGAIELPLDTADRVRFFRAVSR